MSKGKKKLKSEMERLAEEIHAVLAVAMEGNVARECQRRGLPGFDAEMEGRAATSIFIAELVEARIRGGEGLLDALMRARADFRRMNFRRMN